MQQIFNFLIRNKNSILFLFLFAVSIFLTVQNHSFHKSRFISSANWVTGGIYSWSNGINTYLNLEEYNERLITENNELRNIISNMNDSISISKQLDSTSFEGDYIFRPSRVINNNFAKIDNYLTLNRGENSGIQKEFGVITSQGIVGIVDRANNKYSRVISILNSRSRINAQLSSTNHFGSLVWNGEDPNIVQLIDVPRQAPVQKGDTIITGGRSLIFPEGLPIGSIEDFTLDQTQSYYTINIKLFNDMTNIGYVYVIENINKDEIKELQEPDEQ
ncbi:rod shape-determining protein MreC [Christiangramia sp. OXR-203]|jgi:rod shape-determining protein MreC|uniref:rod shape-determining protein MreC n=1 Tax=Christiangramia sp. OXR-203 TaxID=3100176 RepID=UPI002AC905B1|nr:rod shape-determining protein MreC [Christiangramia sp. OXR-203]WPY99047.1 rod shape-determining protein MreC [Christiangramia sp. OXR-203]